jgi:hypothetical protein
MKKMYYLMLVLAIAGCTVLDKAFTNKEKKVTENFLVKDKTVYYNNRPFAELQAITYSLDNGELVKEMNFKLINHDDLRLIGDLIDFMSDRHQGEEIEVEFMAGDISDVKL